MEEGRKERGKEVGMERRKASKNGREDDGGRGER